MNGLSIRTFLGANTPNGFYSLYSPFQEGMINYIIKGGPGTGKSGIMKKVAAEALQREYFTEYCYCSSDANSLDGVRIPEKNLIVADGTAPHRMDPLFPGAEGGIVNTGQCWNETMLQKSAEDIKQLNTQAKRCFSECYHYLSAAGSTGSEIRSVARRNLDKKRLNHFTDGLIRRNLSRSESGSGQIYARFLTGITPQGVIVFRDTIYTLCRKVFVLRDRYGIAPLILNRITEAAVELGHEIYVFYNPFFPSEPEHNAIPSADLAFATSDRLHNFEPQNAYSINLSRFYLESFENEIKRLRFAEKLCISCLEQALDALKREKAVHDDLEEYYISAMDYKKLNALTDRFLKQLF